MALVERYGDWATNDQSQHDPHTTAFDHRINAGDDLWQDAKPEDELAGVEG